MIHLSGIFVLFLLSHPTTSNLAEQVEFGASTEGAGSACIEIVTVASKCCRICTVGKACGDSCINRQLNCHKPPGCACDG